MEARTIIMKVIAVILFAAIFPTAMTTVFAVNTSAWMVWSETANSTPPYAGWVRNNLAITLWNLTGWIILIFGGVMIFISER